MSPSSSFLVLSESLDTFGGGTTTVISSSPSLSFPDFLMAVEFAGSLSAFGSFTLSTPFSVGSEPLRWGESPLVSFAPAVIPFLLEKDLLRDDVDLAGRGLSLVEPEVCEVDVALSPLVDGAVSDLFERKERRSGMFENRAQAQPTVRNTSLSRMSTGPKE